METTTATHAPVALQPGAQPVNHGEVRGQLPEMVPMPGEKKLEFYSGLARGILNTLVLPCAANGFKPPVKSISLRRPGLTKGKRLIVLEGEFGGQLGLLTFLRKLRDEPNDEDVAHQQTVSAATKTRLHN